MIFTFVLIIGEAALPLDHPLNAVRVPPLYEITWERFQMYILMQYDAHVMHTMIINKENKPESILSLAKG